MTVPTAPLLAVVVVAATAVGLLLPADAAPRPGAGRWRHPATWLAIVTVAVLLNQVLFTVYVQRVWDGDVSRIARYLPDGWFALADVGAVADRFPAPHLLGWTVLRAQAALELPFVLLAYLTVCRWFGAEVFRRAVGARWAASASYTVTFCLVERHFLNPYTQDDIALRAAVAVLVPPLLGRLAEGPPGPCRVTAWVASTAALACLVLVVYDVALLYNLGHLPRRLPVAVVAGVLLGAARRWARIPVAPGPTGPGPTAAAATRCLGWCLVLFLVPALPVRYGSAFGAAPVSALAGAVVVAVSVRRGGDRLPALRLAVIAGALGGAVGFAAVPDVLPEVRLLVAAVGAFLVGGAACRGLDR